MTTTKTKVMSLHRIERMVAPGTRATKDAPGVAPKTEVIPPFTLFNASDAEIKDLTPLGSITQDSDRFREAKADMSDVQEAEDDGEAQKTAQKAADLAEAARKAQVSKPAPPGTKPATGKDLI